jgi:uncharacterized protein DUF4388
MSFTGELEHLPIVDVIQLINSSRKSGLLTVRGRKGESRLVFKDGYIVSASHLNNSVRIGQLLVDMGMLTNGQLEQGLRKQQVDGEARKPLAITLIEMELLKEKDAYKALQQLIEMTLVEILTWKTGKFTLEHHVEVIDCEFRYYPEKMNNEVNLNTQIILMDALRVFDEKKRDGLIVDEPEEPEAEAAITEELISVDDLGLSEIDHISTRLPQAFSGAAEFDPLSYQRSKISELAPSLPAADQEKLAVLLARHTLNPGEVPGKEMSLTPLVIFSSDSLLIHGLGVLSRAFGGNLMAFGSAREFEAQSQSVVKNGTVLRTIIDAPTAGNGASKSVLDLQKSLSSRFQGIIMIQLEQGQGIDFTLDSYRCGVRTVLPKPLLQGGSSSTADDFIGLVKFLPEYLLNC